MMEKSYLKIFIICIHFLILVNLSAKEKQPDWVVDYRSVFNDSEYLAQKGTGDSAEKSKTDAAGALARYFQMSVSASLTTTLTSITSGKEISETTSVIDEVKVQSEVQFFALEYTEPWFNKKEKKWYCIAYINRKNAWTQYKPQIDSAKKTFETLLGNAEKERDDFLKLGSFKSVWIQGQEVLKKLEYGRIILPFGEKEYQGIRDEIAEIPAIYFPIKNNCIIFIKTENDYNRVISSSLSGTFSKCGFKIAKAESEASYIVEVDIEDNCVSGEPLSIQPDLNLKITAKDSDITVYSFETSSNEKTIAYNLENARKKIYPKFAKEIEASVYKDLTERFSL